MEVGEAERGRGAKEGQRKDSKDEKSCGKSGLHYMEEYLVPAAVTIDQVKYQS